MFVADAELTHTLLLDTPASRDIAVRKRDGSLLCACKPHEARYLHDHQMVEAHASRNGLRYLRVAKNINPRRLVSLLRRQFSGARLPIAEDNSTIQKTPGLNSTWEHRRNHVYGKRAAVKTAILAACAKRLRQHHGA